MILDVGSNLLFVACMLGHFFQLFLEFILLNKTNDSQLNIKVSQIQYDYKVLIKPFFYSIMKKIFRLLRIYIEKKHIKSWWDVLSKHLYYVSHATTINTLCPQNWVPLRRFGVPNMQFAYVPRSRLCEICIL